MPQVGRKVGSVVLGNGRKGELVSQCACSLKRGRCPAAHAAARAAGWERENVLMRKGRREEDTSLLGWFLLGCLV